MLKLCQIEDSFYGPHQPGTLHAIKATQPKERISVEFKGPMPNTSLNAYLPTVVAEHSRFLFAFPYPNMQSSTVISCLGQIFTVCGMQSYTHFLGASFLSRELKDYLTGPGIGTSNTRSYHPMAMGKLSDIMV